MNYRIRPQADLDLIEFFAFIAQDKIAPADRFLEAAEQSFESVSRMPGMGRCWNSKNPKLRDIRVYPMPSPYRSYLVFYRVAGDGGVDILTALHAARDLEAALERLQL